MDERTMFELLEMHDAVEGLWEMMEKLSGVPCGVGPGEGILGDLTYVTDIILRNSPLYNPAEDAEESEFWRILENKVIDNRLKARILLELKE